MDDRSTPPRPKRPVPERQAPGPLLAVMGVTIVIFIILAFATGEWVFLVLGLFGLAAGLVPILDRRNS